MTVYDDPNREAVGLEPIWTGAGTATRGKAAKSEEPDQLADKPKSKPKS